MPLPIVHDEAVMRVLDQQCSRPHSFDSRRTVVELAEATQSYKFAFMLNSVLGDLGSLVRCSIQAQNSPDTKTDDDKSAVPLLAVAAQYGKTRALKALVQGGANLELKDTVGRTALTFAAQLGHADCVQLLLDAGANANVQDSFRNTPLQTAVISAQEDCARALLPVSNLLLTNRQGHNVFHLSVVTASEKCFELLLPHMSDVDCLTRGVSTELPPCSALHLACDRGLQSMAKALLRKGASRLTRTAEHQHTPLHLAAARGHLSCVVLLVGRPGKVLMTPDEVNMGDAAAQTALHLAAVGGYEKICGVLLMVGARLDARNAYVRTPLMLAQHCHPTNAALLALLSGTGPAQPPGTVCDHCGKTAEQASVNCLKTCGQCHAVRYCSVACSVAAWPGHKAACKARVAERERATKITIVSPLQTS